MEKSYDMVGRRVFIALPAYDFRVSLRLAISLAGFSRLCEQHGVEVYVGSVCGCSVVSRARNILAKDFLESDCTELVFIDSDINFEPESLFRLMAFGNEDPKRGIVAGVPRTRDEREVYIATLDYDSDHHLTMDQMGLVKAQRVATAFMWVRREVFETLVKNHPERSYTDPRVDGVLNAVFDFKLTEEGYMGEDFLFCDRTREIGYEVWIDPTITLGHMGVQEYVGNFGQAVLYPMLVPPEKDVA